MQFDYIFVDFAAYDNSSSTDVQFGDTAGKDK